MRCPVTLLIFSRNDTLAARELVSDMLNYVSEIVIIDSSEKEEHIEFKKWAEKMNHGLVRVYYIIPLGYPDMLRPYALTKCSNQWIIMLDVDERASLFLKENLTKIISEDLSDVFAIFRYEGNKDGRKLSSLHSAQVRIFKKDFLEEKGIIHRLPTSKGRFMVLPREYYILHLVAGKTNRNEEYGKMDVLSRLSYGDLPNKFFNISRYILHFGNKITLTNELSNIDYLFYFFVKEVYSALITRNLGRLLESLGNSIRQTKKVVILKSQPDSKVFFEISKIINHIGLVKFLGLDDPSIVENLTEQYSNGPLKGSDLLKYLLKSRYQERANEK